MRGSTLADYLGACDRYLSGHEQQFTSPWGLVLLAECAADAGLDLSEADVSLDAALEQLAERVGLNRQDDLASLPAPGQ
ncbi:hypothetical protein XEU66b_19155 [Xanthomonas euvesicatoria]|uniref:Uncharacterized protein n=1 Tax=Xanthomonas euvesicatoria pv. vesicatoria (strain 85-10) TaxID=316273 RepID=Q3C069_XANE5|nr:hypothetical protein [Xanthomonas campestris]AOY69350.1 hypothetical protein BHE83_22470 [Xanthomonas euvesicatoria pv. vesicatoria str. 85-10]APO88692.1 hypothetical protein BJD11_00520 [Xanthomonas euvesicatoria]KHL56730.1 hypothetical protein XEU66b_19155 [Xanthomonas euvesicatoria]KLB38565.1 hypothetical protein XEUV206_19440 [Xanthomonas euvesicatoria]KLB46023.1 hypothetical protein XEUV259_11970 [Xanthomonas euvesicatoria]